MSSTFNIKNGLKQLEKKSVSEYLIEYRDYIYPVLVYSAGLLIGSLLMTYSSHLTEIIKPAFEIKSASVYSLFINRLSVYMTVYTVTILLGMCLIGVPFINLIPLLTGMLIGIKVSYYYVNFGVKGVGYALLLIIPESAALITILIYTVKTSTSLSKSIFNNTVKNNKDTAQLKKYLKSYLINGAVIAVTALINAVTTFLLTSIIKL